MPKYHAYLHKTKVPQCHEYVAFHLSFMINIKKQDIVNNFLPRTFKDLGLNTSLFLYIPITSQFFLSLRTRNKICDLLHPTVLMTLRRVKKKNLVLKQPSQV